MSLIPVPRSLNQCIGDILSTFEAITSIPRVKIASPVLSIIEAAAISDFRSSSDLFGMLNAVGLDRAELSALDRIGNDEDAPRPQATFASGFVNIGDSSFTKITSKVYAGGAAPIIGTTTLFVTNAFAFPSSGSVYIGRGTLNFEGPIAYSAKTNLGTFWSLTLSSGTQLFHNTNEPVTVAQGGNRVIPAGSICQTAQGSILSAVQFATLYPVTLPDGETLITNVQVVAKVPGITGNVITGAINSWVSNPFTGATVSNPNPIANARPTADDETYRELIRDVRQSRSLGTPLAIETGVLGITSADENKTVLSASVVSRQNFPTTLYIDDGTGYEEVTAGAAIEVLMDQANGGEQYFQTINRPISKAALTSTLSQPFTLGSGWKLAVVVGGTLYEHTFSVSDFRNIASASSYEVIASINGDSTIGFSAQLANNGTEVSIIARTDTNENLTIQVPSDGIDANVALGFSAGRIDTMHLYKNDVLLNKDGLSAVIVGQSQGLWASSLTNPATLVIQIDDTLATDGSAPTSLNPAYTYTFTNADFINQNTGYTTLAASNSLASWAKVFNSRLPGITATVAGSTLVLTSNLGPNGRAAVSILGGTLVANGMFNVTESDGSGQDYTLNRNTGQIQLNKVLSNGDTLSLGTINTRAFVQSGVEPTISVITNALLWFVVDGQATIIPTGIAGGQIFTWSEFIPTPDTSWGDRVRITASSGTPFTNTFIGDWAIFTDTAIAIANRGAWRVAWIDPGFTYIDIERPNAPAWTAGTITLSTGGIAIVRTPARVQKLTLFPGGSPYTASSVVDVLTSLGLGLTAYLYKTTQVRVRTDSFGSEGDIALVAQNVAALPFNFSTSNFIPNTTSHLASVEARDLEVGTPEFDLNTVTSVANALQFNGSNTPPLLDAGHQVMFLRPLPDADGINPEKDREGNVGFHTPVSLLSGNTVTTENPVLQEFLPTERYYSASPYAIGPDDDFAVLIDGDEQQKKYDILMRRKVQPATSTYGATNNFKDADNGALSLAVAFGLSFNWIDFAVWMKARAKSHAEAGDTNKTILWRYYRHGPDGNQAKVSYSYPSLPSTPIAVNTIDASDAFVNVHVSLPSDSVRTGTTIHPAVRVGVLAQNGPGSLQTLTYVIGFSVASAQRAANVTTLTLTLPAPVVGHGLISGNKIFLNSTDVNFASGQYAITSVGVGTISYADTGANVGPDANPGSISFDSALDTLTGSTAVVGDIASILPTSALPAAYAQPVRTVTLNAQDWSGAAPTSIVTSTTLAWYPLLQTTNLSFFPIQTSGSGIVTIAAAVNALAAVPNSTCPVTAVAVGVGGDTSGVITEASWDEFQIPSKAYQLTDGINWVQENTDPPNTSVDYTFTFKASVTASLATNSDWINEDVRLVPVTAQNVVDYLNSQGVSGLSSAAEVVVSNQAAVPQITTIMPGSSGSVQVQGGLANSVGASVVGSAQSVASAYALTQVRAQDAIGLRGGMWVSVENAEPASKPVFASTTVIGNLTALGVFTLDVTSATNFWNYANVAAAPVNGFKYQIESWGNFVAFSWDGISGAPSFTGVQEGDWAIITGGTVNVRNQGVYRIVRIDQTNQIFWIENPNFVAERQTANLQFLADGSVLPGDTVIINSQALGASNVGSWTVASINTSNPKQITLVTATRNPTLFTGPLTLGGQSSLFQVFQGAPSHLIKKILSICPSPLNGIYADVKFNTTQGYTQINATTGSVIVPLDKLEMPTALVSGIDGYRYSTGLIAEANKVAYGVQDDPATYPGIVAAGALVNIQGPLVRRIQVSLAIRITSASGSGPSQQDVINRVKSAVAAAINQVGVGTPVAIGALISVAQLVPGVIAVTWVSPVYGVGNDEIPVQPYEKPLVLNIDQDVTVSIVNT